MTYHSVMALQHGPADVLQVVQNRLHPPAAGQVGIKVLAASVSGPDVANRTGETLYTGTPLAKNKPPFVPGYSLIGEIDALGEGVEGVSIGDRVGVLTVVGGYSEYVYWSSDWLIPVPTSVDPIQAVPLLLNYIVAYQALHRVARVRAGERMLIIGASGGIGTALLQLGQLAELHMFGLASQSKHQVVRAHGAIPIDYRSQDFVEVIRQAEPEGIDVVMDGISRLPAIRGGLSLLRGGGRMVSFGDPCRWRTLWYMLKTLVTINLRPNGKAYKLYGTSRYFLGEKQPFLEDWGRLFKLLEAGKIKPVISNVFPILGAAAANRRLESGSVIGNVVLAAPELF